jgi:hypothetical protein
MAERLEHLVQRRYDDFASGLLADRRHSASVVSAVGP